MNARHKWSDPIRFEHKSERTCIHCGMIKVSHHEGDSHWIDFWAPARLDMPTLIATDKTPPCTGEVAFSG